MTKQEQRLQCLKERSLLTKEDKEVNSIIICNTLNKLFSQEKILSYYPTQEEVNVMDFNNLRQTAYPRCEGNAIKFYETNHFIEGKYHLMEPDSNSKEVNINEYSLIIIPLVGFDENCNRLGHGAGYYDRFLKDKNFIKVGVAYEVQKQKNIITDCNDIPLDYLITESNIYEKKASD